MREGALNRNMSAMPMEAGLAVGSTVLEGLKLIDGKSYKKFFGSS